MLFVSSIFGPVAVVRNSKLEAVPFDFADFVIISAAFGTANEVSSLSLDLTTEPVGNTSPTVKIVVLWPNVL